MGSSLQGIAFRSAYNKKWISLVTSFHGRDCYVACKDTPDAFCMFSLSPMMGVFSDVEGNWIMQSLDDPTKLVPYEGRMPPDDNTLNHARFSFTKTALGQGTLVSIVTLEKHLAWAIDDNGTDQGVLSLAAPYTLDYVGDEVDGKLTFEYWDSVLSPWPPA
ncbi:hypothetical protein DM992_35540 [Burkholderia sp. JP2-270]|uniref:hypothetical protein n=1 Tax=Burkholderia sp. JP2-270 TaxID=2217913 RepID=UPI000DA3D487|nr:hypothetical protein [Burkholderia sp. JP2-270]AWV04675.1 hypothetical protein DM992_35540 [Burkholderia sp. JP2-270]